MLKGGHLGFMQIATVAQGCRLGNQGEFVLGPHGNSNPQKNFMTLTISRLTIVSIDRQIDYNSYSSHITIYTNAQALNATNKI